MAEVRGLREDMGEVAKKVGELGQTLGDIAGVLKLWWLREEAREAEAKEKEAREKDEPEVVVAVEMGVQAGEAEGSVVASAAPPADVGVPMDL